MIQFLEHSGDVWAASSESQVHWSVAGDILQVIWISMSCTQPPPHDVDLSVHIQSQLGDMSNKKQHQPMSFVRLISWLVQFTVLTGCDHPWQPSAASADVRNAHRVGCG